MLYHQCQIPHKPEENKHGDCLRACIASLLSVADPLDVPHFAFDGDQSMIDDRLKEWLAMRQLTLAFHAFGGLTSLDDILNVTGQVNPGVPYLLFCNAGGDGDHVVIIRNGKVEHDPAWFRCGPYKPCAQNGFWVLAVLTPIIE